MLLGFDIYWAWRSINNGIHAYRGYHAIKATAQIDWKQRTTPRQLVPPDAERDLIAWDDVHHLVIIPTYKETRREAARHARQARRERGRAREAARRPRDGSRRRRGAASASRCCSASSATASSRCRHDAPLRHPRRGARQVIERGVGGEAGEAPLLRRDGLRPRPDDGHELRRRHALPPPLLQRPHLLLRDEPASATARSGRARSSTTTTSGTCRRRCASRTASAASTTSRS